MPKLDKTEWEAASESGAGEIKRMTPGIYDCIITGVQTEWETASGIQKSEDRQCVRLLLDVADGEFAGEFSSEFYKDKPYMHCLYMSWSPRALGMLKHTFHGLDEANPGFDAMAAFEADQWTMFIGKKCRVAWNGTERTNDKGYTNVNARPDRILTIDDNPKIKVELESGGKCDWEDYVEKDAAPTQSTAPTAAPYSTDDIPFL